jgi:thiosulfate/3-mercaptopyruvate sulfurtransferase
LIDATQLETRIGERGLRILDCRFELLDAAAGRRHYMESHIPGAVFVDLEKDLSGAAAPELGRHPLPRPGALVDTFGRLGIDADTTVVLYDGASGAFAARAWWLLRWIGHEKAMLLDGGIEGWRTAGFATVSGGIEPERAYFRGTPRDELVLTCDEIERTGAAALCLVDARAAERFAGAVEPIDRIGGHIPGALNLPFSENLDVSGKWSAQPAIFGKSGCERKVEVRRRLAGNLRRSARPGQEPKLGGDVWFGCDSLPFGDRRNDQRIPRAACVCWFMERMDNQLASADRAGPRLRKRDLLKYSRKLHELNKLIPFRNKR